MLAWLEDEGRLTAAQREDVLHQARRTGERVEEALIDAGIFEEVELLKLLATRYRTRFVTTDRLAKADIDRRALERIPRKLAERLQLFPILFDPRAHALSFVVAAPGEDDVEKQVQVVSGAREVRAYVARPAAIRAAIDKFYGGKARAFAELVHRETAPASPLDLSFDGPPRWPLESYGSPSPSPTPAEPAPRPPSLGGLIPLDAPLGFETVQVEPEAHLAALEVLVTLLEHQRGELRGHSSQVARLCRQVADRVGLSPVDRHALLVAAHLHDVGKGAQGYHLTPLNVARFEGHRLQAAKTREMPARLFASAALPEGAARALAHLYERYDGKGFPDGLAGKDIPYSARVLAIVETYCDLVGNPRNPYRKTLTPAEALSVVKDLSGTLFDPTLAELLRHVVLGAGEATGRLRVLVVDPDPEETTVLEMRLLEHGFAVDVARDAASARAALTDSPHVIVSEVDLGAQGEGFELLSSLDATGERPAFVFVTHRADRESVSRGFELGAADYLVKPASPELIAAKLEQVVASAARARGGVSGSLTEMSLPDVVQILSNGRKTGRLQLVGAKRGEIHFADGQVHDARCGELTGEEAFYALLTLREGTFSLDPSFVPPKRVVHTSTEGLLLEGMRRMDEGLLT